MYNNLKIHNQSDKKSILFLLAICELIAFFSDENPQTVAEKTTKNALEIYGLSDGAAKN